MPGGGDAGVAAGVRILAVSGVRRAAGGARAAGAGRVADWPGRAGGAAWRRVGAQPPPQRRAARRRVSLPYIHAEAAQSAAACGRDGRLSIRSTARMFRESKKLTRLNPMRSTVL